MNANTSKAAQASLKARIVSEARKDPDMTSTQLAERFGCSRKRVKDYLREAGVVISAPMGPQTW